MQKRALSDVVTTILMIVAAMAAIVLIWNFVQPLFKDTLLDTAALTARLNVPENSVVLDSASKTVSLKVERDSGEGNLVGFVFGLQDPAGNVKTFRKNLTIKEYESTNVSIDYSEFEVEDIFGVTITPIYRNEENGKESEGPTITKKINKKKGFEMPEGLLAYWTFDEGGGTTISDSSGNNYQGTISGSNYNFIDGQSGKALQFSGDSSTYVSFSTTTNLNPTEITIIVWINPISQSGLPRIVYKESSGKGWALSYSSSSWRFRTNTQNSASFSYNPTIGSWGQLAGTASSDQVRIYYDSELKNQNSLNSIISSSTNAIEIGRSFKGAIDEVMIFNRALSDEEIGYIYNSYK